MCGFAGIYKYTVLTEEDIRCVTEMSHAIRHRGPDDDGIFTADRVAFGFRRLSIIDLAGGAQPYTEKSGRYSIVYNGEVYNYLELKDELKAAGEAFDGNSEVEVMLRLYALYGPSFIEKLRGMYAFLIYDNVDKTLMAGRDPFGIKPLYYRNASDGIVFSSELKAYLFDGDYKGFSVDKTMAQHYLTFQYVTEPDTVTGDINILPKGSYMFIKDGKAEIKSYYRPVFKPNMNVGYKAKQVKLRDAVESSVAHHMLSDVPLGSFLSSGIDSAVITAVAAKLQPGIKAFTVGFEVGAYNEIADAAEISSHLDIDHIKLQCSLKDFTDNYEKTIYHLDGPVADPSVIAIYLISREAARHVKVVLSGEGSDELFAGYRIYDTSRSSASIRRLPSFVKRGLYGLSKLLPDGVKGKNLIYRGCVPLEERFVGNSFVFSEKEKKGLYLPYDKDVHYTNRTAEIYKEAKDYGYSELLRMQHCDLCTWLPSDILVKGDRLSMANSLEARVPFLDKEVFAAAAELCDGEKLKDGTTKFILRDTFRDLLNPQTVVRPKLGYPVPVRVWLKDELYAWAKEIIENSTATDYINSAEAIKLLDKHRDGKGDWYHHIWAILCFITWYKLYVTDSENTKKRILNGEL
ncbi:MAG: asparagine synthase (glutamine-hydrolyzing) [Ruminococcaceae bacterium]|nr:asparagine synthase (glutamine-hydrolyzing) [Oscillospiraceae bacterium]